MLCVTEQRKSSNLKHIVAMRGALNSASDDMVKHQNSAVFRSLQINIVRR